MNENPLFITHHSCFITFSAGVCICGDPGGFPRLARGRKAIGEETRRAKRAVVRDGEPYTDSSASRAGPPEQAVLTSVCRARRRRFTKRKRPGLLTQSEPVDDLKISLAVFPREVLQKAVPAADHLQQAAPRSVVLLVGLEVVGELGDALGEERDLHFRRAGVLLVRLVIFED